MYEDHTPWAFLPPGVTPPGDPLLSQLCSGSCVTLKNHVFQEWGGGVRSVHLHQNQLGSLHIYLLRIPSPEEQQNGGKPRDIVFLPDPERSFSTEFWSVLYSRFLTSEDFQMGLIPRSMSEAEVPPKARAPHQPQHHAHGNSQQRSTSAGPSQPTREGPEVVMGSESSVPGYFLPAEEELRASALAQACARGGRIVKGEPCEGSNSQGGGLAEEEENEKRKKTDIGLETLSQYFHLTQAEACKALGLGGTSLKKVCRRLGIERWPHRKVKSFNHVLEKQGMDTS